MHIPRVMVAAEVARYSHDIDQIELRKEALEELQGMDGHSFVIYFYDDRHWEIVCVDGKTGFDYNPLTDIYIEG